MKAKSMMKERVEAVIRSGVYPDESELYGEAIRTLFEVKSDLKTIAAVELYKEGEVSNEEPCGKPQGINSHITNTAAATLWQATGNPQVERASEIAGVNVVQFKEILAQKGITRWIGSGEDELKRKTEELKKAKRQTFKKGLIQN